MIQQDVNVMELISDEGSVKKVVVTFVQILSHARGILTWEGVAPEPQDTCICVQEGTYAEVLVVSKVQQQDVLWVCQVGAS